MSDVILLPILELSQAGEARRQALSLANRLGFNETERGKVGIVVTEMASNLAHHAREGLLLLQTVEGNFYKGIEILSLDKGPGIEDIDECLRDGFSTAGTAGNGLGAIARLSDRFEIYSDSQRGTAILAQLWTKLPTSSHTKDELSIGCVCLPKVREEIAGDAWAIARSGYRHSLLVVDGLGHGPLAAHAASTAVRVFREREDLSPKETIEAAHAALRSTRGAALAIAQIDLEHQTLCFAGIGNIAATVLFPQGHYNMVSHNGTVGHEMRKIQEFTYQWHQESLLIVHSDGLGSQWRLDRYPGLAAKHPCLIAGVLYRDFNRSRDDVTVLVAREVP